MNLPFGNYNSSPEDSGYLDFQKRTLADYVASSELGVILRAPEIRARSRDALRLFIYGGDSMLDALKQIDTAGAHVAVVTDSAGRFNGIITRELIVSALIATLFEEEKS